jgi:hypothetical protein
MQQTFEYYIVDPKTWKDKSILKNVKSCKINRDLSVDTLGSATIDITESVGECYIRSYLIVTQNGITSKHPLGTHLVQTPASSFNGKIRSVSMDAYTPLIELTENQPPIGYFIPKVTNENEQTKIMDIAYMLTRENTRAPVVKAISDTKLSFDFVTDTSDNWLTVVRDLISAAYDKDNSKATYQFDIDELGNILFTPKQDITSLQPVWTYDDSNSSILYPDLDMEHDLYGIPNVVEVSYSDSDGKESYYAKVKNEDKNSPVSIQNRGREILHRVTNPDVIVTSNEQLQQYAEQLLRELSSVEYTITYKHGYCPTRVGDCIRLNYSRAGLTNIKAKIISQTIECKPGCPVTEKAVFTSKLWG